MLFKHAENYYKEGKTAFDNGKYDLAITFFDKVIKIDSKNVEVFANRGRC